MDFEINGLPSYGPIAHLVGRASPRFGQSTINPARVVKIRQMYYDDNKRICDIAKEFDMLNSTVSAIVNFRSRVTLEEDLL